MSDVIDKGNGIRVAVPAGTYAELLQPLTPERKQEMQLEKLADELKSINSKLTFFVVVVVLYILWAMVSGIFGLF
jgi:hypothetical protein